MRPYASIAPRVTVASGTDSARFERANSKSAMPCSRAASAVRAIDALTMRKGTFPSHSGFALTADDVIVATQLDSVRAGSRHAALSDPLAFSTRSSPAVRVRRSLSSMVRMLILSRPASARRVAARRPAGHAKLSKMSRHLVAVLHSRPPGDGRRTLSRVEIARDTLECGSFSIANLYPRSLSDVTEVSGRSGSDVWSEGRKEIAQALRRPNTTDVLLGYGIQEPTGEQRTHHRAQLAWLNEQLGRGDFRVWTFGGRPTHPSRWQRVVHRHAPGGSVEILAATLLVPPALGTAA